MTDTFDERDGLDGAAREEALFSRLPAVIEAACAAPAWAERLRGIDAGAIRDRGALARLPVLRKSDLPDLQKAAPPFGGLVPGDIGRFGRLFTSPGPIAEPEGRGDDPWRGARAFHAAGFRPGDVVLNTFAYHLTPGGFIMDASARALGCAVIPAGPGQTETQLDLIEAFRPAGYVGTPDFLNILLEAADKAGRDVSSLRRALVSGAAFPKSLQEKFSARGIEAHQAYATAELGIVAYETPAREGLLLNEDLILEILRPGTGDPVAEGEVGEVAVTSLDPDHPLIRFCLGDLSAVMPGPSPCGRTATRIRGWLGRADQTTKVKGMFVRPGQVAEIGRRHPELGRLRLVVTREGEADAMTLKAEHPAPTPYLSAAVEDTLAAVTKLKGEVELVAEGRLPNDGRVIVDERDYGRG
jgi:phenylacetate-CoA ligase